MTFKEWMGWLGPFFVALTTAILGPTLVEKLKQRSAKPTAEQEQDEDDKERIENLRKDIADLRAENANLRAEREKRDHTYEAYWEHYDECPNLRKKHAEKLKPK